MSTHSHHVMQTDSQPAMRASDAVWLRRGQRLGEAFLASRKYPAYAGAFTLACFGGSLIMLALFGSGDAVPDASASQKIADLAP